MQIEIPERIYVRPDDSTITLRGNFLAAIEYEALTGSSFEQAFEALLPQLKEFENSKKQVDKDGRVLREEREPQILNAKSWGPLYLDLFFAFSAEWRDEEGFDRKHQQDVDDIDPRKRGPFRAFVKMFPYSELRKIRNVVFGLLLATMADPSAAVGEAQNQAPLAAEAQPELSTTA